MFSCRSVVIPVCPYRLVLVIGVDREIVGASVGDLGFQVRHVGRQVCYVCRVLVDFGI